MTNDISEKFAESGSTWGPVKWSPIDYKSLDAKAKENFNFFEIADILSKYGFTSHRLSADWKGADFIAQRTVNPNSDREAEFLKVQLKGRLTFAKKYKGQRLYICFKAANHWYLYPHDTLLAQINASQSTFTNTKSWNDDGKGVYSFPNPLSRNLKEDLEPYRIPEI